MDRLDPKRRSKNMSRIRSTDTKPEMLVRSMLHKAGYRFRLHRKDLPGKPDITLPGRHKAVFVHGCFWHQHPGCREGRLPRSHQDYWMPKLERNCARDSKVREQLQQAGWDVMVVWECEVGADGILQRLEKFLDEPAS